MADNIFEILIKYGLDATKAKEAVAEMDKLEKSTKKNTEAGKEAASQSAKLAEQVTTTGKEGVKQEEAVEAATKRTIGIKQQAREAIRGLAREFPVVGQMAQMALSPITLSVAAITAAVGIMQAKFNQSVRGNGGFEMPDLSEDLVTRYERAARASAEIKTNLSGIKNELSNFNETKDIVDAFATGLGAKPGDDAAVRAQAAREAGDRAAAEAARLRGIAGPFNPDNAAAGDPAKMLPALQAHRKEIMDTLNFLNEAGSGNAGAMWSAKYLLKFGLTDPNAQAAKYQQELSQTDAQIGGIINSGKVRGNRAGAFAGAEAAEAEAAEFYRQAARLGGSAATSAGGNAKSIGNSLNPADLVNFTTNLAALAKAIMDGNAITEQALKDQDSANRVRANRQ